MYRDSSGVGFMVFAVIVSIIAGIVVYFTFMRRDNEGKLTGFSDWMYRFLHFKTLFIEALCKICYLISSIYIILLGFYALFEDGIVGLLIIIGGPLLIRVLYEFSLIMVIICKNTSDISNRLSKRNYKQDMQQNQNQQAAPDYNQSYSNYNNQQYGQYDAYNVQQGYQGTVRCCINCGTPLSENDVFCKNCGQQN